MGPAEVLDDLAEVSAQIEEAVLFERGGPVLASTLADGERAEQFAAAARRLLAAGEETRPNAPPLTELEAATASGSVFVAVDEERAIAATTAPRPPSRLVLYDLRTSLRKAGDAA